MISDLDEEEDERYRQLLQEADDNNQLQLELVGGIVTKTSVRKRKGKELTPEAKLRKISSYLTTKAITTSSSTEEDNISSQDLNDREPVDEEY